MSSDEIRPVRILSRSDEWKTEPTEVKSDF